MGATTFAANDFRATIPRFAGEARHANLALVDLIRRIGARHGATPAQVALSWLLAQKPWIVPLFGTRTLSRFEENLGALDVALSDDDLATIDAANLRIQGARYPDHQMRRVGL